MKSVIARYGKPNEFDHADKGTICRVYFDMINSNGDIFEEYIQRSDDSEKPKWEKI